VDKAIVTVLLIIAGVACVAFIFNSVYPAITRGGDAVVSMGDRMADRIRSQVNIIHAVSEYDPACNTTFWRDTDNSTTFDIFGWAKNVGTTRILAPRRSDVFFGREGNFRRIPHVGHAGGVMPFWKYAIQDGGAEWGKAGTIRITIRYASSWLLSDLAGDPVSTIYKLMIILPNGISNEIYFSIR
jgi:hypothetical protein